MKSQSEETNANVSTALAPVTYTYKLTSSHSLATEETAFRIQSAKDLSPGVFTSSHGDNELRLVTPPETEPTEEKTRPATPGREGYS